MTEISLTVVMASTFDVNDAADLVTWCSDNNVPVLPLQQTGELWTVFLPPHGVKRWSDDAHIGDAARNRLTEHLDSLEGWYWLEVDYGETEYRIVATDGGADVTTIDH